MERSERFLCPMSAYDLINELNTLAGEGGLRSPIRPGETLEDAHRRAGYVALIDELVLEMRNEINLRS